jgi:hypothetical protein
LLDSLCATHGIQYDPTKSNLIEYWVDPVRDPVLRELKKLVLTKATQQTGIESALATLKTTLQTIKSSVNSLATEHQLNMLTQRLTIQSEALNSLSSAHHSLTASVEKLTTGVQKQDKKPGKVVRIQQPMYVEEDTCDEPLPEPEEVTETELQASMQSYMERKMAKTPTIPPCPPDTIIDLWTACITAGKIFSVNPSGLMVPMQCVAPTERTLRKLEEKLQRLPNWEKNEAVWRLETRRFWPRDSNGNIVIDTNVPAIAEHMNAMMLDISLEGTPVLTQIARENLDKFPIVPNELPPSLTDDFLKAIRAFRPQCGDLPGHKYLWELSKEEWVKLREGQHLAELPYGSFIVIFVSVAYQNRCPLWTMRNPYDVGPEVFYFWFYYNTC